MANPHQGETSIEIGGTLYTLKLSTNALCEVEDATGRSISTLNYVGSLRDIRALFWGALRGAHPKVTLADAGKMMDVAGVKAVSAAVGKAIALAFPPEAGDGENPPSQEPA